MATVVRDYQLQPLRLTPTTQRNSFKYDAESPLPSGDEEPAAALPLPPLPELLPAAATLERVPTYLQPRLPWRDRLSHFTFAWYTLTCVSIHIPHPFAYPYPQPQPTLTDPQIN